VNGHGDFGVNDIGHNQMAEYLGIPRDYYGRLRTEAPAMLAQNVNGWLNRKPQADKRLVRTLDGNVRALLSDRYRPLDNFELLENTLPVLTQRPELSFVSADVTETRLYIKLVSDSLVGDVKVGDTIRMGLIISNSEVGMGALMVAPFTDRLICSNGAVHTNSESAQRYFTDETRAADDRAFFLKVRDTIGGILSGDVLKELLADLRTSTEEKIDGDPVEAVELAGRSLGLNDGIKGADLSRWGLANAVTAAAKSAESYDRLTELQTLGGRLMSRPLSEVVKVTAKRRPRAAAPVA
jgi:hypothetical protein